MKLLLAKIVFQVSCAGVGGLIGLGSSLSTKYLFAATVVGLFLGATAGAALLTFLEL